MTQNSPSKIPDVSVAQVVEEPFLAEADDFTVVRRKDRRNISKIPRGVKSLTKARKYYNINIFKHNASDATLNDEFPDVREVQRRISKAMDEIEGSDFALNALKCVKTAILDMIAECTHIKKDEEVVDAQFSWGKIPFVLDIVAYGIGNFGDSWAPRFQLCLLEYCGSADADQLSSLANTHCMHEVKLLLLRCTIFLTCWILVNIDDGIPITT
eukprot:m.384162 g.384162  ORF g.384162 m.384162 type:complete len:213 (+) comp20986_c0_seq7:263-901(+)